jgi:hypothetical protein
MEIGEISTGIAGCPYIGRVALFSCHLPDQQATPNLADWHIFSYIKTIYEYHFWDPTVGFVSPF